MSEKVIGGVKIAQAIDPWEWEDDEQELLRKTLSEVIEQSGSLTLDNKRDQRVLFQRLTHALGLDS